MHYLGLKVNGETGRFFGGLDDDKFAKLTQYGMPPNMVAWHDGTFDIETLKKVPMLTHTLTGQWANPYYHFREWWDKQGIKGYPLAYEFD